MSVVPVFNRVFLTHAMRLFIITLTFLCAGPPILMALNVCYRAISGIDSGIDWTVGMASQFTWQLVTMLMAFAGLTGLIAGICEMLFGRITARAVLAISLVHPFSLVVYIRLMPPLSNFISTGKSGALRIFAVPLAIGLLSFVASMISCWKITEVVWSRTSAAGGHSPT
jgi:hypothetical protein